jgi:hypothetical protein
MLFKVLKIQGMPKVKKGEAETPEKNDGANFAKNCREHSEGPVKSLHIP